MVWVTFSWLYAEVVSVDYPSADIGDASANIGDAIAMEHVCCESVRYADTVLVKKLSVEDPSVVLGRVDGVVGRFRSS